MTVVTWTVSKKFGIVHLVAAGVVRDAVKRVCLLVAVRNARHHHVPPIALDVRHRCHEGERRRIDVHERGGRILLGRIQFTADGASVGLDDGGAGLNGDRFRRRANFQANIHAAHLPGFEQHILRDEGAEPWRSRRHTVGRGLEVRNLVIAILVGENSAGLNVGLNFGNGDLHVGDESTRGVFRHTTQNCAISLTEQDRPGKQNKKQRRRTMHVCLPPKCRWRAVYQLRRPNTMPSIEIFKNLARQGPRVRPNGRGDSRTPATQLFRRMGALKDSRHRETLFARMNFAYSWPQDWYRIPA